MDRPTTSLRRCIRCGAEEPGKALELHHWAPRAIFADAEEWPKSLLCIDCHTRWHSAMIASTPRRHRRIATADFLVLSKRMLMGALKDAIRQMEEDGEKIGRRGKPAALREAIKVRDRINKSDIGNLSLSSEEDEGHE